MVQASSPQQKDTAPPEFVKMARAWLLDNTNFTACLDIHVGEGNPIPFEWLDAAALEAYVAATEALDEWMRTLLEGRPPTQPVVEWENRDLIPHEDAPEAAASQDRWR